MFPGNKLFQTMKHLDRTHILARIIEAKQKRLEVARLRVPEAIVKRMATTAKPVPSFREALEKPQRVRLIAEGKRASPSARTWTEARTSFRPNARSKSSACSMPT